MISQRFSLYNDTKTEALYSQITNVHAPFSSEEEALLKEAEQKTEINSHYSLADPHQYLNNCYIYNGVSLVQCGSMDAYKYKYRPYTILKTTQQTKQPISEEQLYKRLANRRHEEIVYSYSNAVVNNSAAQQPALSSIKIINQSLVNQHSTKSLDKIQAQVRPLSQENARNRSKLEKSKDRSSIKRIREKNQNSANMSRMKKVDSANFPVIETDEEKYTFKSVKNRAIAGSKNTRKGPYNLFSCLDEPINQQCRNEEYKCGPNEIVAARLGSQNWRK